MDRKYVDFSIKVSTKDKPQKQQKYDKNEDSSDYENEEQDKKQ